MKKYKIKKHKNIKYLIEERFKMNNYHEFRGYYLDTLNPVNAFFTPLWEIIEEYELDFLTISYLMSYETIKTIYFKEELYIDNNDLNLLLPSDRKSKSIIKNHPTTNEFSWRLLIDVAPIEISIHHHPVTRSYHMTLNNALAYLKIGMDDLNLLLSMKVLRLVMIRSCLALYTYEVEEVKDILKYGDVNFYYSWTKNFNGYKYKKSKNDRPL